MHIALIHDNYGVRYAILQEHVAIVALPVDRNQSNQMVSAAN